LAGGFILASAILCSVVHAVACIGIPGFFPCDYLDGASLRSACLVRGGLFNESETMRRKRWNGTAVWIGLRRYRWC
jgi:hypothetical protein